jgi:hypothetical protein
LSWVYQDKPFTNPEKYFGFVYIIINKLTNKKYIGKKQFAFKKIKSVKRKKVSYFVESDWQEYHGSSDKLHEDFINFGEENFEKIILKLCKNKSECSYYELKFQMEYDVLLKPDEYYNEWVSVKISRKNLGVDKHT